MEAYESVKKALIRALHDIRPERDIFFEEIYKTKDEPPGQTLTDYFFVDMIPHFQTVGPQQTEITMLIDIAAHEKAESNATYMELAYKIDGLFRPVLRFEDRAITVHNADVEIVDRVLHYSFTLKFAYGIDTTRTQPLMGELTTNFKE